MNKDIKIHDLDDFAKMRAAGKLAADVLDYICDYIDVGCTTLQLNDLCHKMIVDNGASSACLNYHGFPKSICTSVNNVVCHGIPGKYKLKDGDIINIDITVILNEWHGDSSRMFLVGDSFKRKDDKALIAMRLIKNTYQCMMRGIGVVKPGVKFSDIGKVIQEHAEGVNFSVVRNYCGHGIGNVFHCAPQVLHYFDPSCELVMQPGMFFTIEPMINVGRHETVLSQQDGWTVYTKDGRLSAQFEHTIGVTDDGFEIFTASQIGAHYPSILDEI